MVSLQPKLNLKVTQKQILTPGLVQMVSVLALNKLELKDMINAELVENPVLDELEDSVPLLDDAARREEERVAPADEIAPPEEKKDSFEEIDFGSFFRDYLDPGYRSPDLEAIEKPSFENFLSRPTTLTDHLMWQLGSMNVRPEVAEAAELVIGNLSEDGYLIATDEELMAAAHDPSRAVVDDPEARSAQMRSKIAEFPSVNTGSTPAISTPAISTPAITTPAIDMAGAAEEEIVGEVAAIALQDEPVEEIQPPQSAVEIPAIAPEPQPEAVRTEPIKLPVGPALFTLDDLHEGIDLVRQMDPIGVASRDLRECLIAQLQYQLDSHIRNTKNGNGTAQILEDAIQIVDKHLHELQNKQYREISKAISRPLDAVQHAFDYIRTLDPRPGLRYNKAAPKLIEPDVAFIKQGDEYLVVMNDEDVPQLRLNPTYRKMLGHFEGEKVKDESEREVKTYIKDKYKSAIQLIKNIEQRKQTILKVCYAIIGRQREFLDRGIDQLKPMMIKEVAEEIGVHPSTVSRAVASKYAHTPQGVFELRYFFSESVQGPEGGGTSLLILKRRVKKLIDEEDPSRPLTDEQITRILQSQGIQVTRRTVAKYREDMKIPSTHQRRVKS
jgi:RNA polymerase sigma-54 factor